MLTCVSSCFVVFATVGKLQRPGNVCVDSCNALLQLDPAVHENNGHSVGDNEEDHMYPPTPPGEQANSVDLKLYVKKKFTYKNFYVIFFT